MLNGKASSPPEPFGSLCAALRHTIPTRARSCGYSCPSRTRLSGEALTRTFSQPLTNYGYIRRPSPSPALRRYWLLSASTIDRLYSSPEEAGGIGDGRGSDPHSPPGLGTPSVAPCDTHHPLSRVFVGGVESNHHTHRNRTDAHKGDAPAFRLISYLPHSP